MSLGKTNFLIRELINKGLLKIKKFKNNKNKRVYLYILTPHGIKQKASITYGFLKKKIEEYDKLEGEIHQLKDVLKENPEFSEMVEADIKSFKER